LYIKMKIGKIIKNARVLLSDQYKRKHYYKYLFSKLKYDLGTASIPLGGKISCSNFSEYLSVINLLPNSGETHFIDVCLKNASVAFDIGANVGSWSVIMNKLNPACQIYSFEPIPKTFALLERNASLNAGKKILPVNAAVSDCDGEMDFEVPGNVAIFGRLAPRKNATLSDGRFAGASISKVRTIRLDHFCKDRNIDTIDFLKIDVEGFELSALRGLSELILNKRIKAFHIETIRENHQRAGESFDDLLHFIQDCGYAFYLLSENGEIDGKVPIEKIEHHNHVCLPN
jgi:FkbM family methyltransferase